MRPPPPALRPLPTVSVRTATLSDAAALASLLGELGYPSEPDRVHARMIRMLTGRDAIYVAEQRPDSLALGVLSLHRFPGLHDDADVALITALVVAEGARGLGVGRRLVDSATDTARRWGCTRLMVTTHIRRADAHAFYERIGFDLTGRRYVKTL
jgi:GNAT superfamily N-acetyltransferase